MFGIRFATESSYGKSFQGSNFFRTGKRIEQIMKSNSDIEIAMEFANKMLQDAKSNVRFKTGRLQRSIKVEKTSNGFIFYQDENEADYGKHHEFGTRYIEPKPFMIPAWDRYSSQMLTALKNYYRKGTK